MNESMEIQKSYFNASAGIKPNNPVLFEFFSVKIHNIVREYAKDSLILDMGGHDGTMTENHSSIVLDLSLKALKLAKQKGKFVLNGDMHHLPFKDASFQMVLMSHVLEHSMNTEIVIKEAHRILKDGGFCVVVVPNAAGLGQILRLLFRGEVKPSGNPPLSLSLHHHQYTLFNLKEAVKKYFTVTALHGDYVFLPFSQKLRLFKWMSYLGDFFPRLSDSLILVIKKNEKLSCDREKIEKIKKREREIRDASETTEAYTVRKKTKWFNEIEVRNAISLLKLSRDEKILDAGCGAGRLLRFLGKEYAPPGTIAGIDYSLVSLNKFKQTDSNSLIVCGDICSLPFKGEYFNKVVSVQVIQHIPSRDERLRFIKSVHNVLKAHGQFILTAYNAHFWMSAPNYLNKEGFFEGGLYFYCYDAHELSEDLRECGFKTQFLSGSNLLSVSYLKRLGFLGVQMDCFFTRYFTGVSLRKGQYIAVSAAKI